MSVERTVEQIIVARHDSTWNLQRARLLFLLMEENPVSDFGSVEEAEIKIGDLSPKSTEFPDFNTYFKTL